MVGRGGAPHPGFLAALILAALASGSVAQSVASGSAVDIPGYGTTYFGAATIEADRAIALLAPGTRSGVFITNNGFPAGSQVTIRNFPYNTPSANMPATASIASDALRFFFSQAAAQDVDVNIELLPLLQNVRRQTIKCPDCEFKLHWLDKVKNEWNPICDSDYRNNPVGQPKSVQGTVPTSALNITLFNPSAGCSIPGCDGRGGLFAVFSTVQCKDLAEFEPSITAGIILAVVIGSFFVLCCSTICWYFCRRMRGAKGDPELEEDELESVDGKRFVETQPSPQYPPITQYVHQVPAYPPALPQGAPIQVAQRGYAVEGFEPVPGYGGERSTVLGGSPRLQGSYQMQRSYQLPGSSPVSAQQFLPTHSPPKPPVAPPQAPYTNPPSWM